MLLALGLGLAGAGHCLGMCGGVAVALGMGRSSWGMLVCYQTGRILSYTLLGAATGFVLGIGAAAAPQLLWGLRLLAGVLLIGLGLYIGGWWNILAQLEKMGTRLWQPIQELSRRWLPPQRLSQALMVGLLWGALPCGLIYSSLAWAATRADWLGSAILMFCFGLGTLPVMLATGATAGRLHMILKSRVFATGMGLLLVGSGLWTLYSVSSMLSGAGHHHH